MRQVLSLSLSTTDVRQMKSLTKKRGFNSVSSYVKYLLKDDSDLISEAELLKSARLAQKEYRAGKAATANSLADLV
jgi:Arc/MetJ-type ribon-helix-helix transcriptional regulator